MLAGDGSVRFSEAGLAQRSGGAGLAGRGGSRFNQQFHLILNRFCDLPHRRLFPVKQGAFGVRRSFEFGVPVQSGPVEAHFEQERQEVPSRYGPADSLEPVLQAAGPLLGQGAHQHHIGHHEAAPGLEHPVGLP